MPLEQQPDIVAGLALVEELAEHLDPGAGRLLVRADADDLDLLADLDHAALDAPRRHGAAAGDRERPRPARGTAGRPGAPGSGCRRRPPDELAHRLLADLRIAVLERRQRRAGNDRDVVAGEVVGGEELAHLELDELQELGVVDLVDLVEEHHQRRHADLAGQQDVLAGLRHRAVGRAHHQDRPVHLRRAGDHVLHVVGVAGAVDVGIVALLGLVLDMRGRDGDAARLLLGGRVDWS